MIKPKLYFTTSKSLNPLLFQNADSSIKSLADSLTHTFRLDNDQLKNTKEELQIITTFFNSQNQIDTLYQGILDNSFTLWNEHDLRQKLVYLWEYLFSNASRTKELVWKKMNGFVESEYAKIASNPDNIDEVLLLVSMAQELHLSVWNKAKAQVNQFIQQAKNLLSER